MTEQTQTPIYRFRSEAPEPLLSDVTRMTRTQLERAAADPMNIFREAAISELAFRDRLGLRD